MEGSSSSLLLLLPLFSFSCCANGAKAKGDRGSDGIFETFLSDYQLWKQETNPEQASLEGLHEYDSDLSDFSPAGAARGRERCVEYAEKARAILKVCLQYSK